MGREHSRPEWRICVNFAVYFHEPVPRVCLAGYLSLRGPTRAGNRQKGERIGKTEEGRGEGARERERRDVVESGARLDIVSRYLELCVWVFALNRRTRRKTRGLLRPRGLSYQIDAAARELGVGTGTGLEAWIIFERASIGRGAQERAQSPAARSYSPREHGTPSSYGIGQSLPACTHALPLSLSLLISSALLSSRVFVRRGARINPRIMSWRFYFLNKG